MREFLDSNSKAAIIGGFFLLFACLGTFLSDFIIAIYQSSQPVSVIFESPQTAEAKSTTDKPFPIITTVTELPEIISEITNLLY